MCASIVSVFIAPNASSPKVDLCLGIVLWRRIFTGHRIFYGMYLDNHTLYLCQLKDSCAQDQALLFFDFIDAVPKIRKFSCSIQEKGNYFLKIQSNLDISTIEVYMERKHSPLIPKERFRPAQQLLFWIKICCCGNVLAGRPDDDKI